MNVGIYAFKCPWGAPSSQVTDHMCSRDCCDVLSPSLQEVLLQLKTMQKMTRAHACTPSAHCLSCPRSLQRVAVATMGGGSVKDVHIRECSDQH